MIALTRWGDRWAAPNGLPVIFRHEDCGGDVQQQLVCSDCGQTLAVEQIVATPGPGHAVAA